MREQGSLLKPHTRFYKNQQPYGPAGGRVVGETYVVAAATATPVCAFS